MVLKQSTLIDLIALVAILGVLTIAFVGLSGNSSANFFKLGLKNYLSHIGLKLLSFYILNKV